MLPLLYSSQIGPLNGRCLCVAERSFAGRGVAVCGVDAGGGFHAGGRVEAGCGVDAGHGVDAGCGVAAGHGVDAGCFVELVDLLMLF